MKRLLLAYCLSLSLQVVFAQADTVHTFPNGNKLVKRKDLLGIINSSGETLYPFVLYASTKNLHNNLWRIRQEYPDTMITSTAPGWVAVTKMRYGLLNAQNGEIVLPPIYKKIEEDETNGRLLISTDSSMGLMNARTLQYLLEPVYRKIEPLKNGNYIVVAKDTLFYLNPLFKRITQFTNLKRFTPRYECVYIFQGEKSEGLADCDGNRFTFPSWKEVLEVEDDFVFVKTSTGNLAVYNFRSKKKILEKPYRNYYLKDNTVVLDNNGKKEVYKYGERATPAFPDQPLKPRPVERPQP